MTTAMKSELKDVGACRKELAVEIPATTVDAAIERISRRYGRSVKVQGFRPGKVPARVVRARFHDQILRDVAQDLIPEAVDEAVAEHELQPVATPEIRDVEVDDGKPLTFTALIETVPEVDPGDYSAFTLRQTPVTVDAGTVEQAVERLRQGRAQLEPVTERPAERGDVLTIDLERRLPDQPDVAPEHLQGVRVEIGGDANPPGFDDELVGLEAGATRSFTVTHAENDAVRRLAGRQASYAIEVKNVQRPVPPDLDDEFARSIGKFDDLAALRAQVDADLRAQAEAEAHNEVRQDLLRQLANRVTVEVPEALIGRELDRRVEQVVRRLLEEQVDPRQARIDWDAFREQQRASATDAVRGTLVLDEIAGREAIEVTGADVDQEVERQAAMSGRTPQAVRALLEKDGGIGRLRAGLRREKAIALLMKRATIVSL
ncbi:MAG: trigger factor [Acidobacteria bacterium]|nr:trigger factor [Acidobacteriota bacterium]